jgi:hypothetical protein
MGKGIVFAVISEFRLAVADYYYLLGYYAANRDKLSVPSLDVRNLKGSLCKAKLSQRVNWGGDLHEMEDDVPIS